MTGQELRALRKRFSLGVYDLSRLTGIKGWKLFKYETGTITLKGKDLEVIQRLFKIGQTA